LYTFCEKKTATPTILDSSLT